LVNNIEKFKNRNKALMTAKSFKIMGQKILFLFDRHFILDKIKAKI